MMLIKILEKLFFGLALLGCLVLFLTYGGSHKYRNHTTDISQIYPLVIGIGLMLPYAIILIFKKSRFFKK